MATGSAASPSSQGTPAKPDRTSDSRLRHCWYESGRSLRAHPYWLALVTVVLAVGLRFLVDPWLHDQMPYVTFFLAVAVTGLYGRIGPAIVAAMLGAAVAYWCFVPPRYQWGFAGIGDAVGFGVYLAVSAAIVLLTAARNRASDAGERSLREQVEAERQLLDAQALFKSFMDNSPGCAYLRDEQGRHVYVNATAKRLLGLAGELSAQTNAEWFSPQTSHELRAQDEEVLRTGRALQFVDRTVHPDGERYWLTVKFPFVDQSGRRFIGGNSFEITDRVRAEEVLRKTERLASAGQMASLLAHEVNNPLAALTNLMFLLEQQPLTAPARDYVSLAGRELQRINHIASLTLTFYNETDSPSPIDLCKVIDEVAEGLLSMATFSQVRIVREFKNSAVTVGPPHHMRQLVTNLLANALESGSQMVRVRVRSGRDWRHPGRVGFRITIADEGRGISAADCEHVFEPFFTTKTGKGTGLGLWASRVIALRNDGSIRLRSSIQGRTGTCVTVFLPVASQVRSVAADSGRTARVAS